MVMATDMEEDLSLRAGDGSPESVDESEGAVDEFDLAELRREFAQESDDGEEGQESDSDDAAVSSESTAEDESEDTPSEGEPFGSDRERYQGGGARGAGARVGTRRPRGAGTCGERGGGRAAGAGDGGAGNSAPEGRGAGKAACSGAAVRQQPCERPVVRFRRDVDRPLHGGRPERASGCRGSPGFRLARIHQ